MGLATCPYEAVSVVGKIKAMVGKVFVRSEPPVGLCGLFISVLISLLVVELLGGELFRLYIQEVLACLHVSHC